jgi:drug/metabolite transporter (DMT)-like permease
MSPYILYKIIAEAILSLFPVVNRLSSLSPWVISLLRMIAISSIFFMIAIFRGSLGGLLENHIFSLTWIAMGLINFAHIWSSNEGFRIMPLGPALGIFYVYPILAVIFAWFFLGRKVSVWSWVGLLVAFAGVLWMNLASSSTSSSSSSSSINLQGSLDCPPGTSRKSYTTYCTPDTTETFYNDQNENENGNKPLEVNFFGTLMITISAITEALLYIFVISGGKVFDSPLNSTFATHLWGSIPALFLLVAELQNQKPPDKNTQEYYAVGITNGLIGAIGMGLTYLSARHISPGMYALLTYLSIIFGFGYGSLFFSDVIQFKDIIGIGLILFGNYLGGSGEAV